MIEAFLLIGGRGRLVGLFKNFTLGFKRVDLNPLFYRYDLFI